MLEVGPGLYWNDVKRDTGGDDIEMKSNNESLDRYLAVRIIRLKAEIEKPVNVQYDEFCANHQRQGDPSHTTTD